LAQAILAQACNAVISRTPQSPRAMAFVPATLLACAVVASGATWPAPLADEGFLVAPGGDEGASGLVSSSSYSSETSWARGSDGQLHQRVKEVRDESVSDGAKEKRTRAAVACIDGVCEERVKRYAPAAAESLAGAALEPLVGARAALRGFARSMERGFGGLAPALELLPADAGSDAVVLPEAEGMMALPAGEVLPAAVAEAELPAGKMLGSRAQSFSHSYSYSNVNGKEQMRETRCKNSNCTTVERSSDAKATEREPQAATAPVY